MTEFLWGAATSSHQIEGGNSNNDWWAWEQEGNVKGGAKSGAATDHWNRFREDLKLAKDLGLTSYRFSIEWSRVEPLEGQWDEAALDRYEEILGECEKLGLKPMVTLHHFTIPQWFAKEGGFTNARSPELFKGYVKKVVKRFGHRVPLWCTINEPMVYVVGAYIGRFMPPGIFSPPSASLAIANLLRAHVKAYDLIHKRVPFVTEGPWKDEKTQVGFAHNMIRFKPERRFHALENLIANRLDQLYNMSWIEAVMGLDQKFSMPFLLPKTSVVKELIKNPRADFIGVNYYTRARIQWRPRAKDENQLEGMPVGLSFAKRNEVSSDLGWSIDPKGFGMILRRLKRFGRPLFVTENGIADKDDSLRPNYLLRHLREVALAVKDGVDIRGYYHWSLIDNFEWIEGFGPRFGLYSVDYNTFERRPTGSSVLYREVIRMHEGRRTPSVKWLEEVMLVNHDLDEDADDLDLNDSDKPASEAQR